MSRYARALEPAFRSGVHANSIAEHVKASGGINKMASANVRNRRVGRSATPMITLKADAEDDALRLMALEPGHIAKVRIEMLDRAGNTATVRITSVKPRKSPKAT